MRSRARRSRLAWVLAAVFAIALFLGSGPGMLLVSRPGGLPIFGLHIPYLYAWGLLWYVVEAGCVAFACVCFWKDDDDP